jgi:hypothetical protein
VNSAEMPPAVVPAADPADPADRVNPTDRADLRVPPQDPAAAAGPPDRVAGPVAPTTAAAASHQSLARARLTAGLQQRNLLVRHPSHRPARGGPLQRREDHVEKDDPGRRRVWFNCACCPPNIMRLIASLEHYLATESGDTLYIQQYTGSRLSGAGSTWRSPPTTPGPARSTCACSLHRRPGAGWPSACRPGAPTPASW